MFELLKLFSLQVAMSIIHAIITDAIPPQLIPETITNHLESSGMNNDNIATKNEDPNKTRYSFVFV